MEVMIPNKVARIYGPRCRKCSTTTGWDCWIPIV